MPYNAKLIIHSRDTQDCANLQIYFRKLHNHRGKIITPINSCLIKQQHLHTRPYNRIVQVHPYQFVKEIIDTICLFRHFFDTFTPAFGYRTQFTDPLFDNKSDVSI